MNPTLTLLLQILTLGAAAAEQANAQLNSDDPAVKAGADLAEKLLVIAQTAVKAHEAQVGKPLDLSLLKPIDPVT